MMLDQVRRISKNAETHLLTVQVGSFPHLEGDGITSVRVPFIPKIERAKGWIFSARAVMAAETIVKEFQPDLIHAYFAYPQGLAACKIARRHRLPYVVTGRGDDILLYPKRNHYLNRTISTVLRNCNGYIGVSQHIVQAAVALGCPSEKTLFRPNGIPTDVFFWNQEEEKSRNTQQILFAGSLIERKNVLTLARAFNLLAKNNAATELMVAGDGCLRNEMDEILSKGSPGRFRFIGQLAPRELSKFMRESSVFVLPSFIEGWPNVVMEAMACGTPVVASNVCGMPEQIIDDRYGYLVNPNSVEDIADKMLLALGRKWNRAEIARRGSMFSRDETAKVIVEFYQKILHER
jgi:glycosyltransferase involved in cell wall biosynthesis